MVYWIIDKGKFRAYKIAMKYVDCIGMKCMEQLGETVINEFDNLFVSTGYYLIADAI